MGPSEQNTEVVPPTQPTQPAEQPVVAVENQPVGAAPVPLLPVKKSKKGLIIGLIIAGVVLLGLITAGVVFAVVYNSPASAVADAFSKAMAAKSGSVNGTASVKSEGSTFKMDVSMATNESKQTAGDMTVTITNGGKDYVVKTHIAGTKDETYVKIDDLRALILKLFTENYGSSVDSSVIDQYYGKLLDKIDGKWVVIKQSDLEELTNGSVNSKESQCMQDEFTKIGTDATVRNEVMGVYRSHPLFNVESKGSDNDGNHYALTPVSNDKAQQFIEALTQTKFFKTLDDCTTSDLKKSITDGTSGKSSTVEKSTGSIDVWIDAWSHTLNKVAINLKSSTTEVSGEFKMKYDNPSVSMPKADTTVNDLKSEIQSLQESMMSSYGATDTSYEYSY